MWKQDEFGTRTAQIDGWTLTRYVNGRAEVHGKRDDQEFTVTRERLEVCADKYGYDPAIPFAVVREAIREVSRKIAYPRECRTCSNIIYVGRVCVACQCRGNNVSTS